MRGNFLTRFTRALAVAGIVSFSTLSYAECDLPDVPSMPDGKTSSLEEMVAGQQSVKAFQNANADYLKCMQKLIQKAEKDIKKAKGDAKNAATEAHAQLVEAYNAAVTAEQSVANEFNEQIGAYKAANPG